MISAINDNVSDRIRSTLQPNDEIIKPRLFAFTANTVKLIELWYICLSR